MDLGSRVLGLRRPAPHLRVVALGAEPRHPNGFFNLASARLSGVQELLGRSRGQDGGASATLSHLENLAIAPIHLAPMAPSRRRPWASWTSPCWPSRPPSRPGS